MFGGYDENSFPLNTVERFDSRVGEWKSIAPMRLSPRYFAAAALLKGEIYVAGGLNEHNAQLETVEM